MSWSVQGDVERVRCTEHEKHVVPIVNRPSRYVDHRDVSIVDNAMQGRDLPPH